jgi:hypothetical protein
VECLGLDGDEAVRRDFAARRAGGERLLRLDVFRLRHRLPRSWYVHAYERLLPVAYRLLARGRSGIGSGIDAGHFSVTTHVTRETPVLLAIAREPRARVGDA